VANHGFVSQPGNTVTPVDLASRTAGDPVTTASQPLALAAVPGRAELLVANNGHDTVSVVDTATGEVTATVNVGLEPSAVAATRSLAVVTNFSDNTVSVIDLATDKVRATIPVGVEPDAVAIAPTMGTNQVGLALVADYGSGQVTPIDLGALAPLTPVAVGSEPDAVAIAGSTALVANFGSNDVTPVALGQAGFPTAFPVGVPSPTDIAVSPDGTTAWVTGGAALTPISVAGLISGLPISLPDVAEAVAFTPGVGTTAWVAEQGGTLVPVDVQKDTVGHGVTVGGRPSDVVVVS
jgi:YVTN family beta-propeller protein